MLFGVWFVTMCLFCLFWNSLLVCCWVYLILSTAAIWCLMFCFVMFVLLGFGLLCCLRVCNYLFIVFDVCFYLVGFVIGLIVLLF